MGKKESFEKESLNLENSLDQPKKYNLVSGLSDVLISSKTEMIGATWKDGVIWDKPIIEMVYSVLKAKQGFFVAIDVGAQTGCFTLLSKFFPNSRWYAFEPIHEAAEELQNNLTLNDIKTVSVHQLCVSNQSGWEILKLPKDNHWGLATLGDQLIRFKDYVERKVESITLDSFARLQNINKVDFIKIDTEGWELNVLKGAKELIIKDKPIVLMEFNEMNMQQCQSSKHSICDFLQEVGYEWTSVGPDDILCIPTHKLEQPLKDCYIHYASDRYVHLSDILLHKSALIEKILSDNSRSQDPSYQLSRTLMTIRADDADYIPKVPLAGQVFGDVQLMHNGIKVFKDCYYNVQWMTDAICGLKGHHEPQEEKAFYEVLRYIPAKSTMIELGSYWSYYSLWFATAVPEARNYLIEPDPNRLNTGKRNFQLNDKQGFFYHGYVATKDNKDDADFDGARKILIDSFLNEENIQHVNILHADIQSAELAMLHSCVESIKQKRIDYFIISSHSDSMHKECVSFLKKHNYHIVAQHNVSQSCSADGLIVARRLDVPGPMHIPLRRYGPRFSWNFGSLLRFASRLKRFLMRCRNPKEACVWLIRRIF